ncbi:hypothetical protein [Polaribacter aquimarinus]|uniref:Uncharacterized protein n=1 Tax=Polaribacter aquimarinus TaxID=2100726 RepID=A0A2U2JDB0_9FLAO|nr:hypothetical protein [Polaribacter aquimarinus]PWG06261.1 hypothetical protein DIS07_00055 [Polaribacter aquimarinus]
MKQLIIVLVAFLTIGNSFLTHDSVSATFNVIERGHVLLLEIDFDQENYIKFAESRSLKINKEDFRNYLYKTTSWSFDGEEVVPQILSIKSQREHTRVICFLSESKKNIKIVKVKNEFLINVKEHSNILKLDINNSFKDFRLHKNRREIKVVY